MNSADRQKLATRRSSAVVGRPELLRWAGAMLAPGGVGSPMSEPSALSSGSVAMISAGADRLQCCAAVRSQPPNGIQQSANSSLQAKTSASFRVPGTSPKKFAETVPPRQGAQATEASVCDRPREHLEGRLIVEDIGSPLHKLTPAQGRLLHGRAVLPKCCKHQPHQLYLCSVVALTKHAKPSGLWRMIIVFLAAP